MKEHLEGFLRHLASERGASSETLRAYRKDLELFFKGGGGEDLGDIRAFVASELSKGMKKTTAGRRLASVRSFFRYLNREGILKKNPARLVPTPKSPAHLPRALSVDEIFALVEKPGGEGIKTARDRAMLELLYSSGLRVSELCGLDMEDIDLREGMLKARGKGKKERLVPVGSKAVAAVRAYLAERSLLKKEDQALFLGTRGGRISDRGVRKVIAKYARALSISGNVSPHTLRHTFASHLLQSGADLRVIQELLGHSSLSTTQKYTHLDMAKLMEVYDKAHPFAENGTSGRQPKKRKVTKGLAGGDA